MALNDRLPGARARAFFHDSRGWLWVGLSSSGVSMTKNPSADYPTFQNYSTRDGLSSDATTSGNTVTISASSPETARQAFQVIRTASRPDFRVDATFSIPAGKRLVIENVSGSGITIGGQPECVFSMETSINSAQPVTHFFPADTSQFELLTSRRFLIGQVVRIYADGQVVLKFVNQDASRVDVDFTISGYLFDLP